LEALLAPSTRGVVQGKIADIRFVEDAAQELKGVSVV